MTADVIAPIVNDPETFGAIAATNSISDIYAMGGHPLFALNLVFFPDNKLPKEILFGILKGSADACARMGVTIIGGHTVRNDDIKFGLSVIGECPPDQILDNRSAKVEHALVLSKALGTGIIGTAIKKGIASAEIISAATASMTMSNQAALVAAQKYRLGACTDVTGFGLLGHLRNILRGSNLSANIDVASVPLLPGAYEFAQAGHIPGGSKANLDFLKPSIHIQGEEDHLLTLLCADAQTSGGLLFSIEKEDAPKLADDLIASGHSVAIIGQLDISNDDSPNQITLQF